MLLIVIFNKLITIRIENSPNFASSKNLEFSYVPSVDDDEPTVAES